MPHNAKREMRATLLKKNALEMYTARRLLSDIYLMRHNQYLTDEVFAEHNELNLHEAKALLNLARDVYYTSSPEE